MKGFFVPFDKINELQIDSIERLIKRTRGAHFTDVRVRINGQYEAYEADWIKHMLVLAEVDDLTAAQMQIAELADKLAKAERVARHYIAREQEEHRNYGAERSEKPA
jgi:hypothetical protein